MSSTLSRFVSVVLATFILTVASAQPGLQTRKVVFTFNPQLSETELAEIKKAAPALEIVFASRETLMKEIVDADAIIGGVTREQVLAAKKLKWVQVNSAGVENYVSISELRDRPIALTNMKIVQGIEIADHAFALLLGLTRNIDVAVANRATKTWPTLAKYGRPLELHGKTAVVIGVGGIGTQIAIRAKAFGMTVVGVDPKDLPYAPYLDRAVWPDRLDSVLPEADVIFVSAPYTPATHHMIGAAQFARMKRGVLFIAVSRGKIYDNLELVAALKSGRVAGAGLDVTDPEPLPEDHPLWTTGRVIITPHIAGRSDGEGARYHELYVDNLIRFGNGEPLRHVVDKQAGY